MVYLLFEEYIFIAVFGLLSWISSLQFARIYPHNVKYGRNVLYLHCLVCILAMYFVAISYYSISSLLYILCIPSHLSILMSNFILFQWLKIYFSVGATEGWLISLKWCMIIICSISFIFVVISTVLYPHQYIMYLVSAYCIVQSISFISVAYLLMRRVYLTSNLSGIATDRSVCHRLLGSGIILSTSYMICGLIIYLSTSYLMNIRWIINIYRVCIIMIIINTLLLYSLIIKQRIKTHWKKWAKSNKIWDLNTNSRKRHKRKKVHIRFDTEEIPFDPADIRLFQGLNTKLNSNYSEDTVNTMNAMNINYINTQIHRDRKATQKYTEAPINALNINGTPSTETAKHLIADSNTFREIVGFDTMDQLFDEFIIKTEQREQFQSDEEEDDLIEIDFDYEQETMRKYEESESQSVHIEIETDDDDSDDTKIVQSINLLEIPPNITEMNQSCSVNSQQYNLGTAMSADTESIKVGDVQSPNKPTLSQTNTIKSASDVRDEAVLMDIFDNTTPSAHSPKQTAFEVLEKDHFPMDPMSVSKTVVHTDETPMTPIDEMTDYVEYKKNTLKLKQHLSEKQRESLKVVHCDHRPSSAPQSPRNIKTKKEETPIPITKHQLRTTSKNGLKPGMFKSKSMASSCDKTNTFTASFDEQDMLMDTYIDIDTDASPSPQSASKHKKPQKRKKKAVKKWEESAEQPLKQKTLFSIPSSQSHSDTERLLNNHSGSSSCNEEEKLFEYTDIITPNSAISRDMDVVDVSYRKKPILMQRAQTHRGHQKHSTNIMDIDYRKTREYRNIMNDNDIINGTCSNPRFWRHLKKKHSKQLSGKALQKTFTFSFERARYQAVLHREYIPITPCCTPRGQRNSHIELVPSPQGRVRSLSDQSSPAKDMTQIMNAPSKQRHALLETIVASPRVVVSDKHSNTLDVKPREALNKAAVSAPTSPFRVSSTSPSKTPQPSSFKRKEQPRSRPLTPLVLSSKFKKAQNGLTEKVAACDFTKLNNKRIELERMGSKKELDTGGVSAKLNYWKANQLRHDPRMQALERRQKQRQRMKRNNDSLRARELLSLKKVESDPFGAIKKKKAPPMLVLNGNKRKWKNVWRRLGGNHHKEENGTRKEQSLKVHRSYNIREEQSSSSSRNTSSSSDGSYSNSDEEKYGLYLKHGSKHKKRRYAKRRKNLLNGDILNEVRYNKQSMFFERATDSDDDDALTKSPFKQNKYKKARTFSPRTPKYEENKDNNNNNNNNNIDIDRWEINDIWNYIVALFPEMNGYQDNITKSAINGIDFVLMQKEDDIKNEFNIDYPPHIMILLTITRTLLMSYQGTNQKVMKAKSDQNEENV